MTEFIFFLLIGIEVGLTIYDLCKRPDTPKYRMAKLITHGAGLLVVVVLLLTGAITLSASWYALLGFLLLRTVAAGVCVLHNHKKAAKPRSRARSILRLVGVTVLLSMLMAPAFLFPEMERIAPSGTHAIATAEDVWIDPSRLETFETDGSNREVPVHFYYPADWDGQERYPLIVFSHGAFGYYQSNFSTYEELASNGYVVCSLDHPYHAFFTKDSTGKLIIANMQFLQNAMYINEDSTPEEEIFALSSEWNALRVADMEFVLDRFMAQKNSEEDLFKMINYDKIGLIGHSLGGSAAVSVGRSRADEIGAVIDLDGTMIGEERDYKDGAYVFYDEPYPTPLLFVQNEEHHVDADAYGVLYVNRAVMEKAIDAKTVYFKGAGHLNFTDLPLLSKPLASLLGIGTVDARQCIETMNGLVLSYFDHYLKGEGILSIPEFY